MDKHVMLAWVEEVLAPYVMTAPDDIVPLLILDSYQCHMMASVVYKIQELGVEVKDIPGGCTSLRQPVDVGFNKPFIRNSTMSLTTLVLCFFYLSNMLLGS